MILIKIHSKDTANVSLLKAKSADSMFDGFELEFADDAIIKLRGGRKYNKGVTIALVILTIFTLIGAVALITYMFTRVQKTATVTIQQSSVSNEFYNSTIRITSNYKIKDETKQELMQYFNSISLSKNN